MQEAAEALPLWNGLADLGRQNFDAKGQVDTRHWTEMLEIVRGANHVRVWIMTEDGLAGSPTLKPDPRKRYALEAGYDGKLERKFVVGSRNSYAAFKEMRDHITTGSS